MEKTALPTYDFANAAAASAVESSAVSSPSIALTGRKIQPAVHDILLPTGISVNKPFSFCLAADERMRELISHALFLQFEKLDQVQSASVKKGAVFAIIRKPDPGSKPSVTDYRRAVIIEDDLLFGRKGVLYEIDYGMSVDFDMKQILNKNNARALTGSYATAQGLALQGRFNLPRASPEQNEDVEKFFKENKENKQINLKAALIKHYDDAHNAHIIDFLAKNGQSFTQFLLSEVFKEPPATATQNPCRRVLHDRLPVQLPSTGCASETFGVRFPSDDHVRQLISEDLKQKFDALATIERFEGELCALAPRCPSSEPEERLYRRVKILKVFEVDKEIKGARVFEIDSGCTRSLTEAELKDEQYIRALDDDSKLAAPLAIKCKLDLELSVRPISDYYHKPNPPAELIAEYKQQMKQADDAMKILANVGKSVSKVEIGIYDAKEDSYTVDLFVGADDQSVTANVLRLAFGASEVYINALVSSKHETTADALRAAEDARRKIEEKEAAEIRAAQKKDESVPWREIYDALKAVKPTPEREAEIERNRKFYKTTKKQETEIHDAGFDLRVDDRVKWGEDGSPGTIFFIGKISEVRREDADEYEQERQEERAKMFDETDLWIGVEFDEEFLGHNDGIDEKKPSNKRHAFIRPGAVANVERGGKSIQVEFPRRDDETRLSARMRTTEEKPEELTVEQQMDKLRAENQLLRQFANLEDAEINADPLTKTIRKEGKELLIYLTAEDFEALEPDSDEATKVWEEGLAEIMAQQGVDRDDAEDLFTREDAVNQERRFEKRLEQIKKDEKTRKEELKKSMTCTGCHKYGHDFNHCRETYF